MVKASLIYFYKAKANWLQLTAERDFLYGGMSLACCDRENLSQLYTVEFQLASQLVVTADLTCVLVWNDLGWLSDL